MAVSAKKIAMLLLLFCFIPLYGKEPQQVQIKNPRERLLMDFNWKFAYGHRTDFQKDFSHGTSYFSYLAKAGYGDGPASKDFDDRSWRLLDLPHDWAVELPFDSTASFSHGYKSVGRNFPQRSIAWYRKSFVMPKEDLGKRIVLEFDGVFRNATVWFNGFYLGENQSGYYGFSYDVTDYVDYGGKNVVAVRVDATMEEGWFYEGAGIYRHVWLNKFQPLHINDKSAFVHSSISGDTAKVFVDISISNESETPKNCNLELAITDSSGKIIVSKSANQNVLEAFSQSLLNDSLSIVSPHLWSVESPYLYKIHAVLKSNLKTVDSIVIPFGIRSIFFDAQKGFFLNGKHVLLKGTNNHQDHAGVGVALPDGLQEYRIRRLKEMGCNAYRCSHNPPTPELLDGCDRLGMLVIDENRLMGTTSEHLELLKRMILRDRNHPSVILWSIGNEEWAIEGNETGARIATTMQRFVHSLDSTRPVTYANSGGWGNGISTVQEVMGYNYIFNGDIDKHHQDFPQQPSVGTEESTSRGARGIYRDEPAQGYMAAIDRTGQSTLSIEKGFQFYTERPFLSGLFFWTGFDYRGECQPFGWPQVTSHYGILDLCGFPKDMFYYLQSHWTEKPVLHLFPHWNWSNGDTIHVWAYSNCEEVELFLNNKSCGRKAIPRYSHGEWIIPYESGRLVAHGFAQGKKIITTDQHTTGESAAIQLIADKPTLLANKEDVAVITVQIVDKNGTVVPTANEEVEFALKGNAKIIGVGNGDPSSHEPDKFFESISQIFITELKGRNVPLQAKYEELQPGYNDSSWHSMTDEQGNYALKPDRSYPNVIIRGIIELGDLPSNARVILFPKILCEEQSIYINGKLVASGLKRGQEIGSYEIERNILQKGENVYAVVGPPLAPRYLYDQLNTDPGLVQIILPQEQWERKTFNGFAQIILQATDKPGTVTLEAISPKLKKGTLTLQVLPSQVRPYVE